MIYLGTVPKGLAKEGERFEFDGEHANCCRLCKYHCNSLFDMNDTGTYYEPPPDCDELECCKRFYETFIKNVKPCNTVNEIDFDEPI